MAKIKKVIKSGGGLSVFITREAKSLGWDSNTYLIVSIKNNEIIIRKAIIK